MKHERNTLFSKCDALPCSSQLESNVKRKKKCSQVTCWFSTSEQHLWRLKQQQAKERQVRSLHSISLSAAVNVCVSASSVSLTHNYAIVVDTSPMSGSTCRTHSLRGSETDASTFGRPLAQRPSRCSLDTEQADYTTCPHCFAPSITSITAITTRPPQLYSRSNVTTQQTGVQLFSSCKYQVMMHFFQGQKVP